jgi:hypothetical protein
MPRIRGSKHLYTHHTFQVAYEHCRGFKESGQSTGRTSEGLYNSNTGEFVDPTGAADPSRSSNVATADPRTIRAPVHSRAISSVLMEEFISASPFGNLRTWYKLLDTQPQLFQDQTQISVYVDEAVKAMRNAQTQRTRGCIEKAALLHLVGGKSSRDQDELFEALRSHQSPQVDEYVRVFRQYEQRCRIQAGMKIDSQTQTGYTKSREAPIRTKPPQSPSERVTGGPPIDTEDPADTDRQPSIRGGIAGGAAFEVLDNRFIRREPSRAIRFFKVGRVFAILSHSDHTRPTNDSTEARWVTKKGDVMIYTHIRHFAVVREGHGYCWAVMINTYGGRGVAKAGLRHDDVQAHAIIHDSKSEPRLSPGEPRLSKKPIGVDLAEDTDQLSSLSRINFAKITTVEHNVRAMSVGFVNKDSVVNFMAYWRQHLLG